MNPVRWQPITSKWLPERSKEMSGCVNSLGWDEKENGVGYL